MTNKKVEALVRDLSFVYQRQDNVNFGTDVPVSEHEIGHEINWRQKTPEGCINDLLNQNNAKKHSNFL